MKAEGEGELLAVGSGAHKTEERYVADGIRCWWKGAMQFTCLVSGHREIFGESLEMKWH